MILVKRHTSMTDIIIIAKERKENLTGIALVIRENTVFILGNSERSGIIIKNIGVIVLLSIVEQSISICIYYEMNYILKKFEFL